MEITRVLMCELPFILNLPNGTYPVPLDGAKIDVELMNSLVAVHFGWSGFVVGPPQHLRTQIQNFDNFYSQPLRTVIRNLLVRQVADNELPAVGDAELFEDLRVEMSRPPVMGMPPLPIKDDDVRARLDAMLDDERDRRVRNGAVSRYGSSSMGPGPEELLLAINSLIRLYMARFGDPFVETIAIDHVASMSPMHGVVRQILVGDEVVDFKGVIGAIPPIMRGVWANFPEDQIAQFRADLGTGVSPDSVKLMGVRALAFLNRGANRSAINEASAAMDLAVSRKIRQGYLKKGMLDADITTLLRKPENLRFETRAKDLLRDSTAQSAAAFDNTIWTRIGRHRSTHRQGTSHSDAEPSGAEARQVVDDFLWLAAKVDGITLP